jgi:hypothetical protein
MSDARGLLKDEQLQTEKPAILPMIADSACNAFTPVLANVLRSRAWTQKQGPRETAVLPVRQLA